MRVDTPPAVVLVHDADPSRGSRMVGTVGPALSDAGLRIEVATFVSGSVPDALREPADGPHGYRAIVVMGSAAAAYDDSVTWLAAELDFLSRAIDAGTPVFGICFGAQILARVLGAVVRRADHGEHGFTEVVTARPDLIPPGPWMEFHGDTFETPAGATELARTANAVQAFVHGRHLAVQFHPEIEPAVFDAWRESWQRSGADAAIAAAGVDVAGIAADIATRRREARARCTALVGTFLELSMCGARVSGRMAGPGGTREGH